MINAYRSSEPESDLAGVLYCSRATDEMNMAQLPLIIKKSQTNNASRRLTGVLVYGGGMFLQWLEGPRYEVRRLMATLALDTRHETIVRLHKMVSLRKRLYPSWAMHSVAPDKIRGAMVACVSLTRSSADQQLIMQLIELMENDLGTTTKRDHAAVKSARRSGAGRNDLSAIVKGALSRTSQGYGARESFFRLSGFHG